MQNEQNAMNASQQVSIGALQVQARWLAGYMNRQAGRILERNND